jgi:hypothetical protein
MRVLLVVAFLFASVSIFAQEAGRLNQRQILLSVTRLQNSSFAEGDAFMIERSLHQRLQEADAQIVVVESPEENAARTPEDLGAAARNAGADGWMQVTLDGRWTSARIGVHAFDLLLNNSVAELHVTRTTWSSPGSLAQETWTEVVEAVAGKFPMTESVAAPVTDERTARLTITALPGSVVTGVGTSPIRVDSSGSASRVLPIAREYQLRTSLPGYVPVAQRVFLSGDREIVVKQARSRTWGLGVSLSDSRAPGVELTMEFPALSLYARFGVTTYALALALSSTDVLLNDPLTNVVLQGGAYLSPEDRFFRFYLGVGAFVRIVHAKDTSPTIDQVAPLGSWFLVGTEAKISASGRLYFEYTPSMYLCSVPDTLRASLGPGDAPGWLFSSFAGFNLLSFRIGYRWPL